MTRQPIPRRRDTRRVQLPTTKTEPAMIRAGIVAFLSLLATLGISQAENVDPGVIAALAAVLAFVIPLVQGYLTRRAVTANAKVVTRLSVAQDTVVAGEAALAPTGTPLTVTKSTTSPIVTATAVDPSVLAKAA